MTTLCAASVIASSPIIGMTSAQSGVTVDNASVAGNATLFDGSTIQTTGFSSRVQLNGGAHLGLGAGSRVQVHSDRLSLESGMAEVQSASKFEIDARTLRITPSNASSVARVKLDGDGKVLVTALNAPVNVENRDGVLVARLAPGLSMSFLPQGAGGAPFDSTGCVLQKTGAAIITDANGNTVTELRGADLRKAVGNTVHVTGAVVSSPTPAPAGGASQVVTVRSSQITKTGGCTALATKLGATTAAAGLAAVATTGAAAAGAGAAAAGAGLSGVAIAGIAVGATAAAVGGAAAAGAFKSSSP